MLKLKKEDYEKILDTAERDFPMSPAAFWAGPLRAM